MFNFIDIMNMKTIYYFFVFVLSLFFVACESDILVNEVAPPVKVEKEEFPKNWQEQVEFAKKQANTMTRTNIDQVKFVGYTYLGKISTEEQIAKLWADLFADKVEMVVYPNGNLIDYEILPLKLAREKYPALEMDKSIGLLKEQLDSVVNIGTELIEMEWEYKERIIHSTAIIYKDKIVYDHIGCMIVISETSSSKPQLVSKKYVKTRTEGTGLYERFWEYSNYGTSYAGTKTWEFTINCTAFFRADGILHKFSTYAKGEPGGGYACEAVAQHTGGQIGVSNYCQFTWGYAYKSGFSVGLNIRGMEVSWSPGAIGASGTFQLSK